MNNFGSWRSHLYSSGISSRKIINEYFKNTHISRKNGLQGPSTIVDAPFIFDPFPLEILLIPW